VVASAIPPSFHSHSSRSRSVSVPRSISIPASSVASHSRSPSIASSSDVFGSGGPSQLPQKDKDLLLGYLGIDPKIPYLPFNLHNAYAKHCAIVSASPTVMNLKRDEEWQALCDDRPWFPKLTDFIDIFIANSQYYGSWRKPLNSAMQYPDMHDWLALETNRKPDNEVWGFTSLSPYNIEQLKAWVAKKERKSSQREVKAAGSSSKKRQTSPEKKKKKKKKPVLTSSSSDSSRSPSPVTKAKKKGKKKQNDDPV
jgi:hypothetical protein